MGWRLTSRDADRYHGGMPGLSRDFQHSFHVDSREYVVEVCSPRKLMAPVSASRFDSLLTIIAPEALTDPEERNPGRVVAEIADQVRVLLPRGLSLLEWQAFERELEAWVAAHRRIAVRAEWLSEWHELQLDASDDETEEI